MVLPLRVSGHDGNGKAFSLLAHTLDVSSTGARLAGVRTRLEPGTTVTVQYRTWRSQFRIAWVGSAGSSSSDQIGIEYIDAEKRILGLDIPYDPIEDNYEPPEEIQGKFAQERAHMRHLVEGGAEVRAVHSHVGIWGKLTDISLKGCYLQMTNPLAIHTRARLLLKIGHTEIDMRGVVRTSHPQVGMGIEFTEPTSAQDGKRLHSLIHWLMTGERPPEEPQPRAQTLKLVQRLDTVNEELQAIEEVMKSANPDPLVLRQFRETLGHMRTSAWAVQQWLDLSQGKKDSFALHGFLNHERIRLATHLCRTLANEMPQAELTMKQSDMNALLRAVEDLFSQLAGFSVEEVAVDQPEKGVSAEVAEETKSQDSVEKLEQPVAVAMQQAATDAAGMSSDTISVMNVASGGTEDRKSGILSEGAGSAGHDSAPALAAAALPGQSEDEVPEDTETMVTGTDIEVPGQFSNEAVSHTESDTAAEVSASPPEATGNDSQPETAATSSAEVALPEKRRKRGKGKARRQRLRKLS